MSREFATPLELPAAYEPVLLDDRSNVLARTIEMARQGYGEGTLVWATAQENGPARPGKTWYSPDQGLYLGVVLEPEFEPGKAGEIGLVGLVAMGVAIAEEVAPMTDLAYRWPNDILLSGSKVGGVQLRHDPKEGWLVLGVSINVAKEPGEVIDGGCVCTEGGTPELLPEELLKDFARSFLHWLNRWDEEGLEPVLLQLKGRQGAAGDPVLVALDHGETVAGVFQEVTPDGSLSVEVNGQERLITLNEFFSL